MTQTKDRYGSLSFVSETCSTWKNVSKFEDKTTNTSWRAMRNMHPELVLSNPKKANVSQNMCVYFTSGTNKLDFFSPKLF